MGEEKLLELIRSISKIIAKQQRSNEIAAPILPQPEVMHKFTENLVGAYDTLIDALIRDESISETVKEKLIDIAKKEGPKKA